MESNREREEVDRFIREQIDSVPHLEALLLLFETRPKAWTVTELASRLYLAADVTQRILIDLNANNLIAQMTEGSDQYYYSGAPQAADSDELISSVRKVYRRETVRISTMIHAKPSPALRDFARAFRFRKEPS